MDHDRLPVLNLGGPGPSLMIAGLIAAVASGCLAPGPTATPSASPTDQPVPSSPGTAIVSAEPSFAPVPLTAVTIVCESWGSEPPAGEISCKVAAALAMDAIDGARGPQVHELDVAYGEPCVGNAGCERRADVRTVLARSSSRETLVVRVARDAGGEPRADGPAPGDAIDAPAFDPPERSAPDLGVDAPALLQARDPFGFCGAEDQRVRDAFDTKARRCFLDGVAAWQPVELIVAYRTDDGVRILTVFRYPGRGAIEVYVRTETGWHGSACAISPIARPAVFVTSSPCDRIELGT